LLAQQATPKQSEIINFVVSGVSRMENMIRGLLEYSRLTYSQVSAFQQVDLREVLGEVLWNLQSQIAASGAIVRAEDLPTVVADRRALVQLLQNLVANAIKYVGNRAPEVHISVERLQNGDRVFHVHDNGIGLDMRHADKIFEVFTRLHGPGKYEGTGIGLSICRRIVELHGGRIWVESEPEKGATFSFTLPEIAPYISSASS